jgi:capsular polysaccharide biosynthesis protein
MRILFSLISQASLFVAAVFAATELPRGCDIRACEIDNEATMRCNVHALLDQHSVDRVHLAATTDLRHPVQPYLLDPSPWPHEYEPLTRNLSGGVVRWVHTLDYCYILDRHPEYATDLMSLVLPSSCDAPSAVPARGFLLIFHNAFINLRGGEYENSLQVFDCSSHVLFGGCNENVPLLRSNRDQAINILQGIESSTIVPRAVAIMTRWGSSYYHWILEELPRLMYVREELASDPTISILMHDHSSNRFLLHMLGISPNRIVPVHGSSVFFVRQLLVPPVAPCGRPSISAIRAMRDLLRNYLRQNGVLPSEPDAQGRHVLVIQRSGPRQTHNHAELMAALRRAFPALVFEEYGPHFVSINETARLFGGARGVIGVHGAGMSNVVFSAPGAFLLEFHPHGSNQKTHPNFCHQGTAAALDMRHAMVWLGEGEFNGAVTIPPQEAIRALCAFEGGPASTCASFMLQRHN